MSVKKLGISPENFYGQKNARQERIEAILKKCDNSEDVQQPKFMTQLLGPSKTWKIFKKQQDAIDCCFLRRNGLMPFAFEDINARRMFLAAHPKFFWVVNRNRFFKNCCSYEIIREYSACKLYLDIEFEYLYNSERDGVKMLNNLLNIINFNLKEFFNITCTINDALDLDSSTDTKFSHHVIYEIKNVAFQHNYAVGNFVKRICGELKSAFLNNSFGDNEKLLELSNKYNLLPKDILDLFIHDQKGQTKLFIDEGVYTKNRHFRLLGSSKQAKKVPLTISSTNLYKPNCMSDPLDYFLDSLITYFSWNVDRVLEFEGSTLSKPNKTLKKPLKPVKEGKEFPLNAKIDCFIEKLILPNGRIRKKVFFSDSSTIVYDIQGFRYCHNIEREHKSNNIKFIVDLGSLMYYQKCYDPDCLNFRSDMWQLPDEICFFFDDDSFLMNDFEFSDEEFAKAIELTESNNNFEKTISDEDLEKVADCAEAMLEVDW